jgi:hypothetical protein
MDVTIHDRPQPTLAIMQVDQQVLEYARGAIVHSYCDLALQVSTTLNVGRLVKVRALSSALKQSKPYYY